jgi:MoxR-like ATPase
MPITPEQAQWFANTFTQMADNVELAVRGKDRVVRLALTCMLSEGHLLLEDYPGTGKTQLAKAMANTVKGSHSRIQFTPDLLPSDVTGVTIYDQRSQQFTFHQGPIFATIVLADEINRASPKTQSALLEVMEESRVTVDGTSHEVGSPFMVIATQNPIEQAGTYRLPEAQLDRFLMKTSLGYPDHETTVELFSQAVTRDRSATISPVISAQAVAQMSALAGQVHVDPAILAYVSRLSEESRRHPHVSLGLSIRGGLAYIRCAKVWAVSQGRDHVLPDDIKDLAHPVLSHRLMLNDEAQFTGVEVSRVVDELLDDVAAPAHRLA